ncbi:MAG: hypothetical protein ACRDOF_04605 [Gaiellaceae bacterium]
MTERGPDFDTIVGSDLDPAERARLRRVHELLIEAGPPPELGAGATVVALRPRRRRVALVALAAALGLGLFGAGWAVGHGDEPGTFDVVTMTGSPYTTGLSASLTIFDADEAGNWPMELEIEGLEPSGDDRPYELWLTRKGKLAAPCGSFLAEPGGRTVVPLNAPYRLKDFDGWVVVVEGSESPLLTT